MRSELGRGSTFTFSSHREQELLFRAIRGLNRGQDLCPKLCALTQRTGLGLNILVVQSRPAHYVLAQFPHLGRRQHKLRCARILFKVFEIGGAGNREHRRRFRQ